MHMSSVKKKQKKHSIHEKTETSSFPQQELITENLCLVFLVIQLGIKYLLSKGTLSIHIFINAFSQFLRIHSTLQSLFIVSLDSQFVHTLAFFLCVFVFFPCLCLEFNPFYSAHVVALFLLEFLINTRDPNQVLNFRTS